MDDAGHMTPDEFRRCGAELIERIARYMEEDRALPGPLTRGARIGPRAPAPHRARTRRALRRRAARRRPDHHARSHALAVAELLRLLPGQRLGSVDPGRSALLRPGGAGHALGDQPRLHRARNPRARLAGRPARTAGAVPVEHGRRRRHPGQRVQQHAHRAPRSARARQRRRGQRTRRRPRFTAAAAHRLHVPATPTPRSRRR